MKGARIISSLVYVSIIIALIALLVWSARTYKPQPDPWEDIKLIFKGITEISIPENVSSDTMTVYSKEAFPVLVASTKTESADSLHPIVTAGRYGKGKFAAYGHQSFLIFPNATNNTKLLINIAKWENNNDQLHNIGMCLHSDDIDTFHKLFNDSGINSRELKCSDNELGNVTYLKEYDVILLNGRKNISENETEGLLGYVASGGGLILGADPPSFKHQTTSEKSFWGNRILNSFGSVAFSYSSLLVTGPQSLNITKMESDGFIDLKSTHAYYALDNFKKFLEDILRDPDGEKYNREIANQTKIILDSGIRSAPKNFSNGITDQVSRLLTTKASNKTEYTASLLKLFFPNETLENFKKNSSRDDGGHIKNAKMDEMV